MNTAPIVPSRVGADVFSQDLSMYETDKMQWYAAYTCARHEKRVAQQLEERRIESFLPTYRSVRKWKDRRKVLELPLFPSYLFVHLDPRNRLDLLRLPGVLGIVCFQGKPAALERTEIENLRQGLVHRTAVHPHPYLKAGRRVRVRSGAMAGVEGIIVRERDCARIVLSISLLQRSVCLDIDTADVEPFN
jgi:transcription termination/antitermination protein NusG